MTKSEHITFPANGGSGQGYLALPEGQGPHRAVVVIQEWWGLNEHIKDIARRFADAGYLALAPDLYHGAVADEPDDARRLVMDLQIPEAAKEMTGAAAYLAGRGDVAPKKVGTIGFWQPGAAARGYLASDWRGRLVLRRAPHVRRRAAQHHRASVGDLRRRRRGHPAGAARRPR